MIFGPRPFDVRARPAEARSEERPEPTFVGEDAPQDRNEGGRDAAASGRWEKINGLLGFLETARPFPTMAILDANNVTVCMHEKPAGSVPAKGAADVRRYERHWTPVHIDIHTTDFDAVVAKVRAEGGHVEMEFRDHGPKPAAFCCDPFGNGFCVIGERAT